MEKYAKYSFFSSSWPAGAAIRPDNSEGTRDKPFALTTAAFHAVLRHYIICAAILPLLLSSMAQAAVITVNTDTSGSGCTIMDAIDSANADSALGGCLLSTTGGFGDDTIVLPPDNNIQTLFAINNAGPFGSTGLPVISSNIIIEGNSGLIWRSSAPGTPSFRLFYISTDASLTLNNLRLQGGVADDGNPVSNTIVDHGSAIFNYGGSVVLNDCTITTNHSGNTLSGSTVFNQSTGSFGAELHLDKTSVKDNTGSGILSTSQGTVTNHSLVVMQDSTISSNTGVGVSAYDGSAQISRSEISDNQSGGIRTGNNVILKTRDSTISGNQSTFSGGGLAIVVGSGSAEVSLINVTVTDNTAVGGGGIMQSTGTLNLINTLVSGNHITAGSGNEIQRSGGVAGTQLNNLFGDSDNTTSQALSGFSTAASDITATGNGSSPRPLNQIIHPLKNNGGPNKTHALAPGSPALNSAIATYFTGGLFISREGCASTILFPSISTRYRDDQRGVSRPQYGQCDIGAFEQAETSFMTIPLAEDKLVIFDF